MKKTITFLSRRAAMMLLATLLFTLTAQTVWAAGDIYVGYLDPTAPIGQQRKTVLNPVRVDGNTTEMGTADETTWYLVSGTFTNDTRIEVKGTVNLILTDGCNFTASKGLHVPEGSALNIYAQSVANSGSLTANNDALTTYAAIGGNGGEGRDGDATSGESAGDITIYGGTITTTNGNIGGGDGGKGRAGGQSYSDEDGEHSDYFAGNGGNGGDGDVTIYSGYVWVKSGNIGGGKAGIGQDSPGGDSGVDGYNGDGTVKLSWANTSDGIYADYYYGSVTLLKAFYGFGAGEVINNDDLRWQNLMYAGDSYTVTIGSMPDGVTATADLVRDAGFKKAVVGQVVTISFSGVPAGKVPVVSVTYGDNNDNVNDIIDNGDGTFSFVMPNGNATVTASDLIEKIPYILENGTTAYCTNYTVLDNTMTTISAGWYVVNSDVTVNSRIDLTGDTNLILGDGYTLNVKGIYIPQGSTLTIYAQSDGVTAGKIVSKPTSGAAIGGMPGNDNGNIVIYGGIIEATGGDHCAGIGSNDGRTGGTISIYGGTVTAKGGTDGAAIGGGRNCSGGTITIYGGTITTDSDPCENGAGIGGGDCGAGGTITIYGGNITTYSRDGAGIGGGDGGDGGIITINGGTITSTKVNQGNGARIGGGLDAGPGTITINGGKITAVGGSGAGIGGGKRNPANGTVTINGGVIDASGSYGIGAGEDGADIAITLGWTEATKDAISITSSSFVGTVKIAAGKRLAYTDGNNVSHILGGDNMTTLTTDEKTAIAGKTLTPAIVLADNADNTSAIATATTLCTGGKTLAVQLSGRTLYKDGYWNTLCLPFSLGNSSAEEGHYFDGTLLEGATVMELDGSTSNLNSEGLLTLNFTTATSIEAGKPYIVKWQKAADYDADPTAYDIVNPVFSNVTVDKINNDVDFSGGTFMGNYKPLEITVTGDNPNRNDYVVLAVGTNGNMLGYVNTNRTLGAFHAYFYIPANGGNPGASSFVLNADDESTQTGIGHTEITDITENSGAWYTLDGRKLQGKPTQKGIYIYKGKKVKR